MGASIMGKQIVIHILAQWDDILARLARSYSRLFKVLCHFPVGPYNPFPVYAAANKSIFLMSHI